MRRQLWLQRNQAVQVINLYAEAMRGGKQSGAKTNANMPDAPKPKVRGMKTMDDFISSLK